MTTSVLDPAGVTQSFTTFLDGPSVAHSDEFGDGSQHDLCGDQTYRLSMSADGLASPPSFLTLSGFALSLQTDNFSDEGDYTVYLIVELIDYDSMLPSPIVVHIQ